MGTKERAIRSGASKQRSTSRKKTNTSQRQISYDSRSTAPEVRPPKYTSSVTLESTKTAAQQYQEGLRNSIGRQLLIQLVLIILRSSYSPSFR